MASSSLWKLIKISIRLGVAGGAVYATANEGLWGTPEQAILFYHKVKEEISKTDSPLPKEYEDQLLAAVDKVKIWSAPGHVPLTEKWNQAVLTSVTFLDKLPEYLGHKSASLEGIGERAKKIIS